MVKLQINDQEATVGNWLELVEKFVDNAFYCKEIEEKRKLLNDVGENLILRDKKLEFQFKKPYDVCLKADYRTNWLALVNEVRTRLVF